MTTCSDCGGSQHLPDGSKCQRCSQSGEIATGKYKTSSELCDNCWGSGKVNQSKVNIWFAVRVIPITLLLFGGGGTLIWVAWMFTQNIPLTGSVIIILLALWGGLTNHFIVGLRDFGPMPATNWFVLRAGIASISVMGIGGAVVWIVSALFPDPRVISLTGLTVLTIWALLLFVLILFDMPESS